MSDRDTPTEINKVDELLRCWHARTNGAPYTAAEHQQYLQRCREQKAREYQRRREIILARNKAWRKANPEKAAAQTASWKAANPERAAALRKQWYADNRDLQLARAAARTRDLVDSVVKSQFCRNSGLSSRDVPDEIVPMVRTTLQIRRHLKTLNHKSS